MSDRVHGYSLKRDRTLRNSWIMVRSPKSICGVGKVALRNAPYG
ncbi:hypothetical protein C789_2849 [Microcystis aeruginosa FACHB-905 = DIANCHI905]|nr:hypothetical protein C789_2849 [Microcystis aeruginosa FACHB-905 = DIANCHI905]